jgi:hypothetical protein
MINKLKILRQKSWLFEFMSDNVLCENNVNNKEIRRSIETDLMHLFKNTNNIIINSINKQPSLFNIKYFTFQNDF